MEIVIKVNSTYNNTIVSALYKGKILKTISTGSLGFKKAKRASTLAAQTCGEALGSWLLLLNKNLTRNPTKREFGSKDIDQSDQLIGYAEGKKTQSEAEIEYLSLLEAKKKVSLAVGNSTSGNLGVAKSTIKSKKQSRGLSETKSKVDSELSKKLSKVSEVLSLNKVDPEGVMLRSAKQSEAVSTTTSKKDIQNQLSGKKMEYSLGVTVVMLLIAGVGYGKFGVIRGLSKVGLKVKTISDVTSIPHNGCKPPKMRRK